MAIQITGITDEPRQRHILLVNDEEITLTLNFYAVSEFWTFDVSWRGDTFTGFMMSLGVLHIRALNWPFDFFVSVNDSSGQAPFRLGDFAEGRCELYFVAGDEVRAIESGTATFPEVAVGDFPPVDPPDPPLPPYDQESLILDFLANRYRVGAVGVYPRITPFPDLITFTRASGGGRFNSAGVFEYLGNDVPRLDYDPVTLQPRGLLIEEARTNLLLRSSEFDNAYWVKTRSSISPNSDVSPDGTSSADKLIEDSTASNSHFASASASITTGVAYTTTVFVKDAGRTRVDISLGGALGGVAVTFDLVAATGAIRLGSPTYSITQIGGYFRLSVTTTATATAAGTVNFALADSAGSIVYTGDGVSGIYIWGAQLEAGAGPTSHIPTPSVFTSRASTATYFDEFGVLQVAGVDVARFDHRFINGEWVPTGLFLEAAATNLALRSAEFDNASWTKSQSTVAPNTATSPDGTANADKLIDNSSATTHYAQAVVTVVSGTAYTYSIHVKAGEVGYCELLLARSTSPFTNHAIARFDLATGAVISGAGSSVYLGDGWWRLVVIGSADSTGEIVRISLSAQNATGYPGDGVSGIYIWGAQLEAGAVATSHIPTVASTVTRSADVSTSAQVTRAADFASVNTLSPWYNASEGFWRVTAEGIVGQNLLTAGDLQIVADSAGVKTYELAYTSDQSASSIVIGMGHIHSVKYWPRANV